jgi:hypothetical protein
VNGDPHTALQPRAFEEVYAVFDRDDHASYFDALQRAESLNGTLRNDAKQAVTFKAIASVPCFELWLLLHFAGVHAPMHRNAVLQQLRQHMSGYQKGADDVFSRTYGHLPLATARAALLATQFSAYTEPEPYTAVADLVTRLTTLRG